MVNIFCRETDDHTWFNELNYNGIAALATDWKNPAVFAKVILVLPVVVYH